MMDFATVQQVGVLHRIGGLGGRPDFEAQMQYWDELYETRTARLARWIWGRLNAVAKWRPTVKPAGRLARA
jgi:hypothetical protein